MRAGWKQRQANALNRAYEESKVSIYSGLEATIRQLRMTNERNHSQYIASLTKQTDRIDRLMIENDELSNRIHLDLDPRIKRLVTELNAFDAMNNKLREERDSYEASDRSACIDYEEMLKANDGLQTRIDALKLAILALA